MNFIEHCFSFLMKTWTCLILIVNFLVVNREKLIPQNYFSKKIDLWQLNVFRSQSLVTVQYAQKYYRKAPPPPRDMRFSPKSETVAHVLIIDFCAPVPENCSKFFGALRAPTKDIQNRSACPNYKFKRMSLGGTFLYQ